jgi:isoquinoline 1-oxidoreductase alpha subunit
MIQLTVNEKTHQVDIPDDTPLLWVIREELKLTGTKFGCGKGLCGACTVLVGKTATRSCILPVIAAVNNPVTTIEGLIGVEEGEKTPSASPISTDITPQETGILLPPTVSFSSELHPVQKAWLLEDVVQCGYCQPGQILTAVALLENTPDPTDTQITEAMSLNLCRCGTYPRIHKAVKKAAELIKNTKKDTP